MSDSWNEVEEICGGERFKDELLDYDIARLNTVGPISFQGYLYALVRAEEPSIVIETGVLSGVSTTLILAAMGRNRAGELHSCDPCHQGTNPAIQAIEAATGMGDRVSWARWQFYPERSSIALPKMPEFVDMFIHDSDHRKDTMAFELAAGWEKLLPGGLLVCDDWSTCIGAPEKHDAFDRFVSEKELTWHSIGSAAVVRKPESCGTGTTNTPEGSDAPSGEAPDRG
jgi:predicted O-methyltransferase YrrM